MINIFYILLILFFACEKEGLVSANPEIEFVCANDEYCDATDPEAQNALWNSLRSVEGIVSYKQDWSHDDPVGNPVSMAVIIKDPAALSKVKALADEHGVEIDLDSIERRSEKYLDTLASGETPYVVDVMFHEEAAGVGIITKQNTTADVKKGETKRQAAKFGNKFPPSKHK